MVVQRTPVWGGTPHQGPLERQTMRHHVTGPATATATPPPTAWVCTVPPATTSSGETGWPMMSSDHRAEVSGFGTKLSHIDSASLKCKVTTAYRTNGGWVGVRTTTAHSCPHKLAEEVACLLERETLTVIPHPQQSSSRPRGVS